MFWSKSKTGSCIQNNCHRGLFQQHRSRLWRSSWWIFCLLTILQSCFVYCDAFGPFGNFPIAFVCQSIHLEKTIVIATLKGQFWATIPVVLHFQTTKLAQSKTQFTTQKERYFSFLFWYSPNTRNFSSKWPKITKVNIKYPLLYLLIPTFVQNIALCGYLLNFNRNFFALDCTSFAGLSRSNLKWAISPFGANFGNKLHQYCNNFAQTYSTLTKLVVQYNYENASGPKN